MDSSEETQLRRTCLPALDPMAREGQGEIRHHVCKVELGFELGSLLSESVVFVHPSFQVLWWIRQTEGVWQDRHGWLGEGWADSACRVRTQGMNDSQGCSREGAGQGREKKGMQA